MHCHRINPPQNDYPPSLRLPLGKWEKVPKGDEGPWPQTPPPPPVIPAKTGIQLSSPEDFGYTSRMKFHSHPGEVLKEDVLADAGLTVARAAEILGVGRPALSAVLNGRASLSPEMALRFEKAFGVSMELMLKMQLNYDIAKTRKMAKAIKVQKRKRAA